MAASAEVTATSIPASRTASTAWMWSQCPWVSTTWRTSRAVHRSSSLSCSLAASMRRDSPVDRHRTM